MIHAIQDPLVQHVVLSHSVVSDSLQPHGLYPAGILCYGILQARILEWVAIDFSIVQHIRFIQLAVIWIIRPCWSSDWLSLVLPCLCSSNLYLLNNGLKYKSSDVGNSNKPKRSCTVHPFSEKVHVFNWVNKGKEKFLGSPGSPMIRTWSSHQQGLSSIPGQGAKILQTGRWGQKKKPNKWKNGYFICETVKKEKECVLVLLLHFKSQKLQSHFVVSAYMRIKKGIKFVR